MPISAGTRAAATIFFKPNLDCMFLTSIRIGGPAARLHW
jgi:hypothetical protein